MEYSEILKKSTDVQSKIALHRPFEDNLLKRIKDYYRVSCTYTSNSIEGFSYTETETKVLLEDGLTAGGKPLRDMYAVLGHAKAHDYMFQIIKKDTITEKDILTFHSLLSGALDNNAIPGSYRQERIFITGTDYKFLNPEEVPQAMKEFFLKLESMENKHHPIELAAFAHKNIATIHPFGDGNGRVARLAMNTILIQHGYLPAIIPPILRNDYIAALKEANFGSDLNFKKFIARSAYEELLSMYRHLGDASPKAVSDCTKENKTKTKRMKI